MTSWLWSRRVSRVSMLSHGGILRHVIVVTDPADPRIRDYASLTDVALRRAREPAEGLFLAEGENVIRRALAAGYPMRSVLAEGRWLVSLAGVIPPGAAVYTADSDVLRAVTGYPMHRGALASMSRLPERSVGEVIAQADRLVVLEDSVDPANVGGVFRAAAALDIDGVLLSPSCADPLYRRAVRVSMAAVLTMPWARVQHWPAGLAVLADAGFSLLALTPAESATPLEELPAHVRARCALLIGSEGPGLTERVLAGADFRVRIPMSNGIDSLNLAAAAAVACYAVTR